MSFILRQGKTKTMLLPVTASTVLTKDTLVTFSSGLLIAATSGTASADIVGVVRKTIAATDSDYATSGRLIPVEVPTERYTVWEGTTASAVATDIGVETDLTDAGTVNRGATSVKAVRMNKLLSATKGLFWIKFFGAY